MGSCEVQKVARFSFLIPHNLIKTSMCVCVCVCVCGVCGLCSDDDFDDIPVTSPTTRSLIAWDLLSRSSPVATDTCSPITGNVLCFYCATAKHMHGITIDILSVRLSVCLSVSQTRVL